MSGAGLLSGDIFQMLGLPSVGSFSTPLEKITDSVLGPHAFENFRNEGTKKLLDVVMKGVVGKGQPKICRHKYPNRCKCPKMEGAGIMDLVKQWDPKKILGTFSDLVLEKAVKHALGGKAIGERVDALMEHPQVQEDIKKMTGAALKDMLIKHEQSGGVIPEDHPIFVGPGPVMVGGRMVAGHWWDYLNPIFLAKKALHATHIDRVLNKIPIVGSIAKATGVVGHGKRPRGRPRKHRRASDEMTEVGSVAGPMSKKERQAKYRAANRDKLREKQRLYRENKKMEKIKVI
jgi:hypothetical protein